MRQLLPIVIAGATAILPAIAAAQTDEEPDGGTFPSPPVELTKVLRKDAVVAT